MESTDLRLIEEFDGSKDVVEWLAKVELVCKIRKIKELSAVIPLRLTGGAFAVYLQLSDGDKEDAEAVKRALKCAFGLDSFSAYEKFTRCHIKEGESVDVYLADLKRLGSLFGCSDEKLVSCAFVAGLPDHVKQALRAGARIESMGLGQILERARMLLTEDTGGGIVLFGRSRDHDKENLSQRTDFQCRAKQHVC